MVKAIPSVTFFDPGLKIDEKQFLRELNAENKRHTAVLIDDVRRIVHDREVIVMVLSWKEKKLRGWSSLLWLSQLESAIIIT